MVRVHLADGIAVFAVDLRRDGVGIFDGICVVGNAVRTAVNGVLDTKPYADEIHRSWIFRSVGYGNDYAYWKDMISNLRMVGYDYAISIEHEDSLMSQDEGLSKAVDFLKDVLITQNTGDMWWV